MLFADFSNGRERRKNSMVVQNKRSIGSRAHTKRDCTNAFAKLD